MQKVVGSSPIIRFRKAPLGGVFYCGAASNLGAHPANEQIVQWYTRTWGVTRKKAEQLFAIERRLPALQAAETPGVLARRPRPRQARLAAPRARTAPVTARSALGRPLAVFRRR
jgi:hypothetical protein